MLQVTIISVEPKYKRTIFFRFVLAVILLCGFGSLALSQQRAIANPSLELPSGIATSTILHESNVPGWLTTHPLRTNGCASGQPNPCRPIELWGPGLGVNTANAAAGTQFAELNAHENSMIYQTVCLTQGESFTWSFLHRQRGSFPSNPDVAQFRIGIPTMLPAGSKPNDSYGLVIAQASTSLSAGGTGSGTSPTAGVTITPLGNGWVQYSGTYMYADPTRLANIGFAALSTGSGDPSVGNFIDNWQIQLQPYLEFSAASAQGSEGTGGGSNSPANRPAIRIGGTVPVGFTASVVVTVTGGTAIIGQDYSLNNTFQTGNTTATVNIMIPPGTYDGASASSIFPIPFAINPENTIESNETVTFQIGTPTNATLASVAACGTAPVAASTYTIINDDVTAAQVTLSGRAVTADGRGAAGVLLTLTPASGVIRIARTSPFGYFSFSGIQAGSVVILHISSKQYIFEPSSLVLSASEDLNDIIFTAGN